MARALRIEYEGAWYHVMNRGAARQPIFRTEKHYVLFLQLLAEIKQRFHIEIHAYCLMPNHYHLLLRTPFPNLSNAMRHLNSIYTRKFNISSKRDGPLLRGRFKSIIVDSENYLLRLSRYIHLNPVKAKLAKKPEDFTWSSYQFFLNDKHKPCWLHCNDTLSRFKNGSQQIEYQLFVNEGIDQEIETFYQKIKKNPILGTEVFTKKISEQYLKNKPLDPEINEHQHIIKKQLPTVEEIFLLTADFYRSTLDEIIAPQKNKHNLPKDAAIYIAIEHAQATLNEVATFLGNISYSAVSKAHTRFREQRLKDHNAFEDVKSILQTHQDAASL